METQAIILSGSRAVSVDMLPLIAPTPSDVVVAVHHSGISTGTEKLFWSGEMPPFPGMGYPLVPGYEAVGEVVEAGRLSNLNVGDTVFVPGANCYDGAHGLFGGASRTLVSDAIRTIRLDSGHGARGALLALAATARHALAGPRADLPDLIVGHGVLGRLLARLTVAAGGKPPVVWEKNADRRTGADDYIVIDPDADDRHDYGVIYDASGDASLIPTLIQRLKKGGEIVLAGFYPDPINFAFPPAFMKEARFRVAAEWTQGDLLATRSLIESGALSMDGLITHRSAAQDAPAAYEQAFDDPACLKMILDWEGSA
ncbi:chlorophyll synthesis pathway protein BchC [Jannaschia donghaensis]|uniref:Putative L-galactonate oxidoreductase n=1 Tax=Jannaschia donghaensis TaxID=420998 RepID=A0A0M6YE67_9RHOB|nr:chlorophyll synthesis pathway protein BchC [Jannaschia donghaensis]CTQ48059.1 Putative L-galactonate oxidoreductase [Jannaschia donghaensis]